MKRTTPEGRVLAACKQVLQLHGITPHRINGGMMMATNRNGSSRAVRFAPAGFPDLVACVGGRFVAIECKAPKGKQSPAQIEWQRNHEREGGVYLLVDDAQVLDAMIRNLKGTP